MAGRNGNGRVVFFHDRGYSAATLLSLRENVEALRDGAVEASESP